MKQKAFIVEIKSTGQTESFKSRKRAFVFCVDNKLVENNNFGWKQATELQRLKDEGVIDYREEYIDVEYNAEARTNAEIKKYIATEIDRAVNKIPPKQIQVVVNGKEKQTIARAQHYQFENLLKCLAAKTNVMMVGAAGSGKTTTAAKVSEALGIPFYSISVGIQTSKVEFMGYMDANGKYVRTLWREAYENGGNFLIDEIDAGNPGIMTVINAALANDICAFPDKMVKKHEDFICCAAANTWGRGADRMYVGRNQLDAATLDRFVKMNFDYDEKLEDKIVTNKEWLKVVRKIRSVVYDKKMRVLVTPRASIYGSQLLEQKIPVWEVLQLTLFNTMSEEEKVTILTATNISKETLNF